MMRADDEALRTSRPWRLGGERMSDRRVLIVGGGIAGLTLAIALARAGRPAEVVDIREDWELAGWGVSLTGPTLRALRSLELLEPCVASGYAITEITNCAADGSVVGVISPPRLSGADQPAMVGILRPVFHNILRERALELATDLRLATTVVELEQQPDGALVRFNDGRSARYEVVVGADGVGSPLRALIGIDSQPRFTGQVVWRALVRRPGWASTLHTFAGPVHNAGLIPISRDDAYVFLTENGSGPQRLEPDADLAETMRGHLAAFSGPLGEVRERIVDPDTIVRRPIEVVLVDRPWHRGHAVIVGDAAHAPSPQLVSGAALAVEDALVLSELLAGSAEPPDALAAFSERRFERCRMVVESSVQIGEWERERRFEELHGLQERCFRELAAPI
jgi:2-polyprenyl-6-methoxyphenol hydroxylase-like FAD-dependent oxidoreductase